MAVLKLSCGTEYKIEGKVEFKKSIIYINGVEISECKPIVKKCNCGSDCKSS